MPVWVAAAAKAAVQVLLGKDFLAQQSLLVPDKSEPLVVPVSSASILNSGTQALGISHCDPGCNLDLTRGLEVWVLVELLNKVAFLDDQGIKTVDSWLKLVPGIGVGTYKEGGETCISGFAKELLKLNLRSLVPSHQSLRLEVVLPKGRELAARTSNESFGVVDGLALIGTQVEVQASAMPDQLEKAISQLKRNCSSETFQGFHTFVIGENGYDLAQRIGLNSQPILKIGNWVGPLLVAAAKAGVDKLLLIGYHGKLIKLAGGIFHTHHHLADGRLEILTALAVREGLPLDCIHSLIDELSVEAALIKLEAIDRCMALKLWQKMALLIEERSFRYVNRYGCSSMAIGAAIFDRQRKLRWAGAEGLKQLNLFGVVLEPC